MNYFEKNRDFLTESKLKEETEINQPNINLDLLKFNKYTHSNIIQNIRTDINNSGERIPKLKKQKKRKSHNIMKKIFPSTLIIDKTSNQLFKTLMNSEIDNNISNEDNKQNITFSIKAKTKEKLLKDYKEFQKNEKKFRKIKIIKNLYDSLDDNEESTDDEENDGLKLYIPLDSFFIFIFDLLLIFFSLYTLLFIPLDLAGAKFYCEKDNPLSIILKLFTEIIYICDVLISFFRSYFNYKYEYITLTKKIIKNYITHGFLFDLIEAFPSYSLTMKICNKKNYYKFNISKIEIFYSILLIIKSFKIFKTLNNKKNRVIEALYQKISQYYYLEQLMKIFINIIIYFSFFHSLICIHIFIGRQSNPNWINYINLENENLAQKYIASFYFIIATMTTVGFGDIVCISPIERIFQIILLAIGTVIYSFIITTFGNYIGKHSTIELELDAKKNILEQIRITYPLMPFKLYYKIHNYLVRQAYKKQNNKNIEIFMLVNTLPDKFRNILIQIIYKDVINNFKIFKECNNSDFIIKMLTCFVQATCKKDNIIIQEGNKIESIVFVKDGRLALEATINLLDPFNSLKKYFKDNFKGIDSNEYKNRKNSFLCKSGELNQEEGDEENNMTVLQERLNYFIESNTNKSMKNKFYNFDINNKNNDSFQIGINDKSLSSENGSISDKIDENNHYLKILDIRKSEYFGDVHLFLGKPSPLTLKVKSKKAEIFFLKYKDAININKIHHNIMKRIQLKSYKNLLSIKRKTFNILTNYYNTNKFNNTKGKSLQDMSWFTERSRNISIMDKTNITNISSSRKNIDNNLSLFSRQKNVKNSCLSFNLRRKITNNKINTKIRKSISTNSFIIEQKNNKYNVSNYSHLRWSNRNPNRKSKFKEHTTIESKFAVKRLNSLKRGEEIKHIKTQYKNEKKFIDNSQSISNNNDIISNLEKIKANSKNNDNNAEMTNIDEEMKTIEKLNSNVEKNIKKKIKLKIMKEKIIKLWKLQNKIFNYKLDHENGGSFSQYIEDEHNLTNNLAELCNNIENSINDINSILFKKLMEYLDIYNDNVIEEEESSFSIFKSKNRDKIKLELEKNISFKIESSYYNLNKLTNQKIIKDEVCKKEIKALINNYIEDNKITRKNKSSKKTNKYMKNFTKVSLKSKINNTNQNTSPNNTNILSSLDDISSISSKRKNESIKKATKTKEVNNSPKKENKTKIISNKIKQTINNTTDIYINFKNMDINYQNSNIKFDDKNDIKKIILSEICKNKNNLKLSKSSTNINLMLKDKKKKKNENNLNINNNDKLSNFHSEIPKKGKLSSKQVKFKEKLKEK